jgi:hypothetical protein
MSQRICSVCLNALAAPGGGGRCADCSELRLQNRSATMAGTPVIEHHHPGEQRSEAPT